MPSCFTVSAGNTRPGNGDPVQIHILFRLVENKTVSFGVEGNVAACDPAAQVLVEDKRARPQQAADQVVQGKHPHVVSAARVRKVAQPHDYLEHDILLVCIGEWFEVSPLPCCAQPREPSPHAPSARLP